MRFPRGIMPLLCALLALPAAGAPGEHEWETAEAGWRHGPVRYLLTRQEAQVFKKLRSDEERATFIAAFWDRRDPTPETRRNEFREEFYSRVRGADSLRFYFSTSKPMWLTDLGRIYVLMGPPTSEESSLMAASERNSVVWTYDGVRNQPRGHLVFDFVADETGELRLSVSPELDRATIQGLASHTPADLFQAQTYSDAATATDHASPPSRSLILGGTNNYYAASRSPQDIGLTGSLASYSGIVVGDLGGNPGGAGTSSARTPLGDAATLGVTGFRSDRQSEVEVRTTPSFEAIPVAVRTDYYQADDGTTYAAFTLGPGSADTAQLVPFGGIISLDDPGVTYSLSLPGQYAPAGPEAPGTFQTGLGIDPGRYRALFGLQEQGTGRVGTWEQILEVPALTGSGLTLSSLTLARVLEPVVEGASSPHKVPFVLGSLRVVPRTTAALRNGEEFHLYYQVYGAQAGDDGPTRIDAVYRFQVRAGGEWTDLGNPIEQPGLTGGAQAWSFPLRGWPVGEFRLLVEVTEPSSGRSTGELLEFRVEG